MDADRFDAFTRSLLVSGSRRRTLGAALGGVLGLLALESSDLSAAKTCKGLKGKKKKKCLKKARHSGCRNDAECRDQIESCQSGRCQRVCEASEDEPCPGCALCLIRYEANGDRTQRCAGSAELPALLTSCTTDTDCPNEAPLCISFNELSCTEGPCGTCAVATGSCDEPECQNDADCPDLAESCQGGECKPVCSAGACPDDCGLCRVRIQSVGERTQACGDSLTVAGGGDPVSCTTDADCTGPDTNCLLVSTVECAQPPCCFSIGACEP